MSKIRAAHRRTLRLTCLLALSMSLSACAGECAPQVRDGWIRLGPVGMPMMAGFGRIQNACPAPVAIVAVSSPAFADASLHETRIVDGVSRMRALPELRLTANETAVLEPGGMHLMLMQPQAPLRAGDEVTIEFALRDGRRLRGAFQVRNPGG